MSNGTEVNYVQYDHLLTFVSIVLGSVAIILAMGGVLTFFHFRAVSKKRAEEVARETAEKIAEKAANDYIQANLPEILAEYKDFSSNSISDNDADRISEEWTDDKTKHI